MESRRAKLGRRMEPEGDELPRSDLNPAGDDRVKTSHERAPRVLDGTSTPGRRSPGPQSQCKPLRQVVAFSSVFMLRDSPLGRADKPYWL